MQELRLKKCAKCGAMVRVIKDCNCPCNFTCCDEVMQDVVANSVDASKEKHVPTYEIKDDKLEAKVNHVMEEDHYIKWLMFVTSNVELIYYFKPGDEAKATFPYQKGILYAYCNKHSLWSCNVK